MFNNFQKVYDFCGSFQVLRKTKEDRQNMNNWILTKAQIASKNKKKIKNKKEKDISISADFSY